MRRSHGYIDGLWPFPSSLSDTLFKFLGPLSEPALLCKRK